MENAPKFAIIDPNTLAVLGLKSLLSEIMPIVTVDSFSSFAELQANTPDQYFHFFVAMNIAINNRLFFLERKRKTIVLTTSLESKMNDFHCLHVNVPVKELTHALIHLAQGAHHGGKNLPAMTQVFKKKRLTGRELEVLALIVQGYINKEIADKLSIGLATVVTHRRKIMEKLEAKSVSALTIYAVLHGYVDINKI